LIYNTKMAFPDLETSVIKEPFLWEEILEAKEHFERTNVLSNKAIELFKQGASQGGARPKLSVDKKWRYVFSQTANHSGLCQCGSN